jgi:general secretion pathway protein N
MARARSIFLYGGVALATATVATLASLPVSFVASAIDSASQGQVRLEGATGSVWDGRGQVRIALAGGAPLVLPRVEWSVRPWRLLLAELAADVRIGGSDIVGKGVVAVRPGGFFLRDAEATLPASVIADRVVWLRGWNAGGTFEARSADVEILRNGIVGAAQLVWRDASANRMPQIGSYQAALDGDGRETRFRLTTLAGPLQLAGQGAFDAAGAIRVQGTATTDPANRARLAPLLSLFGPPRADGTVAFEWPLGGGQGGSAPARAPAFPGKSGAATKADATTVGRFAGAKERSAPWHG